MADKPLLQEILESLLEDHEEHAKNDEVKAYLARQAKIDRVKKEMGGEKLPKEQKVEEKPKKKAWL